MKTTRKNLILLSFMLFSMFFGAGNLIFPPFVGQTAGTSWLSGMLGFLITAVGFPVLGIAVIARFNGITALANHVHPYFSTFFTVLIYLSIGPLLAIPRAATLPFEMAIAPYLPEGFSIQLGLFIFSVLFFSLSWWLSRNPNRLVEILGKLLTPVLLLLILIVFSANLFYPTEAIQSAQNSYAGHAFTTGFLEGYQTMDALAALAFGIVVAVAVRSLDIKDEKEIIKTSIFTGCFAGIILALIYLMLAYLGATVSAIPLGANGAVTLTLIVTQLFGIWGALLLAVIFFLACITTCVGLLTSCSEYFHSLTPTVSYVRYLSLLSLFAMVISNFGLSSLLEISVPILNAIYPMALIIILLGLFHSFYSRNRLIYPLTMLVTGIISVIFVMDSLKIQLPVITGMIRHLPLYELSLGWVTAAAFSVILSLVIDPFLTKTLNK